MVSDALYPWHKGGKEIRYRYLLDELPRLGFDIEVFSMRWWDSPPREPDTGQGSLRYVAICPRVPLYRGDRRSIFQSVLFAAATLKLLRGGYDLIEADHMPYLQLIPLRIVAWARRVPLVVTWHEVWGREGWRTYLGRLGAVGAAAEALGARLPNEIVAVSAGTAEKLSSMGVPAYRVQVISNAIDLEELATVVADPAAPELLFVGRLLAHKNAHLAIEAASLLRERGHDVRLGIVGVGPEERALRDLTRERGLEDRVTFYGSIEDQRDVWALMRGCRVLLAPSVREGYGLVVAEALALGTPVVGVRHPDNESSRLIDAETGSLVDAESAAALADAAATWLSATSSRAERARHFLAAHDELTPAAMARAYGDLLRRAVVRRTARSGGADGAAAC